MLVRVARILFYCTEKVRMRLRELHLEVVELEFFAAELHLGVIELELFAAELHLEVVELEFFVSELHLIALS